MAMFKLRPSCKDYLWGGSRLRTDYGIDSDLHPLAEAWVLSCHPDGPSTIAGGSEDGKTLTRYIEEQGWEILGTHCRRFEQFPILTKFIDAKGNLSIQVHPDNAYALEHEHQYGKTEMWYVVSETGGASLRIGFDRRVDAETYAAAVADHTICDLLRDHPIAAGDVFFLPAGRVHSIGAGAFIAEIQQTSDLTYRIYDYDRPGPDGKPRELHTELAKEAIDYTVPDDYRTHYERIRNKDTELVACPYFTTHLCDATFSVLCDYSALDSFVVLIFVAGAGELVDSEGNRVAVRQGETVLIPASTRQVTLLPGHGGLRFLSSYIETPEE